MPRRAPCAALVLGAFLTVAGALDASAGTPVVAAGSGANLAATRVLADAYGQRHPGVEIQVPPSIGSAGGVRAVAEGAIAIGLTSRPLRDSERDLGLTVVPYARTAIVLGAHASVTDDTISTSDLVEIYAGRKARWSDGREIVVLTREPADSSIEVLQTLVPGFGQAYADSQQARRWPTLFTDLEMAQTLMRTPHALGLTDMGAMTAGRLGIKALRVNGVAATAAEVKAGRYNLVKTLYFVLDPRRKTPEAQRFVDFTLSREGAAVLAATGYLSPSTR